MAKSFFDVLLEDKEETQVEQPSVVPTRPDAINATSTGSSELETQVSTDEVPTEKSFLQKITPFLAGSAAPMFPLEGKDGLAQTLKDMEENTTERRMELVKKTSDVGYEGANPEATTFLPKPASYVTASGQIKSGFGLTQKQVETAYTQGLSKKEDGTDREVNFIYDTEANPFFFEGALLMSVERDDGTFTPYGRPTAGVLDYTQTIVPFIAAEIGVGAAVVSTALAAGTATANLPGKLGVLGKIASPFVTIATLYGGGVFAEKARNELSESLGIKKEDDKNNFFRTLEMISESVTAPATLGSGTTPEENLSGLMEAAFGLIPVGTQQIKYVARQVSDKLKKQFEVASVSDDIFRSAIAADKFRRKMKMEKLLPTQISANKILQRGASLSEQVVNIIPREFRKQNRALYEYIENVRDGKGGGDIKKFQRALKKFETDVGKLDLGDVGQINAEMLLHFRELRRFEAEELYKKAHETIGFKPMDLTAISETVRKSPKTIVPTSETGEAIVGTPSVADWDDGAYSAIVEQLNVLGKNKTLNRQQISAAMKNYVDNVDAIDSVTQEYYKSPAQLLHLYAIKLGQMSSDIRRQFPDRMPVGAKNRITEMDKLRTVIQSTIRTPVGADETLLKAIGNNLDTANNFFKETQTTLDQGLIKQTIIKATLEPDTLKDIPTAIIGRQGGLPSGEIPDIALNDLNIIENYIRDRLKVLRDTGTQTEEALKGKLRTTKDKVLNDADAFGMTALRNGFRIQLANKLNKMATPDPSKKGPLTAVDEYLSSYSSQELELLGMSKVNAQAVRREASEIAKLDDTLSKEIQVKADTTRLGVAIGDIFNDPANIETNARSLLTVARRTGYNESTRAGKPAIRTKNSVEQAKENIKRGLIDYIFSTEGKAVVPITKNSAYGEVGDYTVDPKRLGELVRYIKDNKTLKNFFDKDTLYVLDGITNYAQVIQSTGADAGSALSGAQLVSNLYTLDPMKFITVVGRLGAQKLFAKIIVKEGMSDALLGQLKIAKSGNDSAIRNMISTKGYIGSTLASAYLESKRTEDVYGQSEELFGSPNSRSKSFFDVLIEPD